MIRSRLLLAIAVLLLCAGAAWMLRFDQLREPGVTRLFLVGALVMGSGFLLALKIARVPPWVFWGVAIGLRVLLLPMQPGPDIYRYVWEGSVQNRGFNPYLHAPDSAELAPLRDDLWEQVEHKSVPAIYPPMAQLVFRAAAAVSHSIVWFKILFVAADVATLLLLVRRFGRERSLVYGWNPLVIYAFAGGGHYDSLFVLAVLAAWLLWERSRVAAVFCAGVATALKWVALPLAVWMIYRMLRERQWQRAAAAAVLFGLPLGLPWLVVTRADFHSPLMAADFARYARSTELLPAIVGWLWPATLHSNEIFLLMFGVAAAILLWFCRAFEVCSERYFLALLVCSPMVHAWYFTWLIPFAVQTRNAGTIAVSVGAFAYFGFPPADWLKGWTYVFVERAVIWLPFLAGFGWAEIRRRCS